MFHAFFLALEFTLSCFNTESVMFHNHCSTAFIGVAAALRAFASKHTTGSDLVFRVSLSPQKSMSR
jgi:hypothetical protein